MPYTMIHLIPCHRNLAPKLSPQKLEATGQVLLGAMLTTDEDVISQIQPAHICRALFADWQAFRIDVLGLTGTELQALEDRLFRMGADPIEATDIAGQFQLHINARAEAAFVNEPDFSALD